MESLARVFSSASAARFPPPLRDELLTTNPKVFEESLYGSYLVRQPSGYKHNPTRVSIAITANDRLVVTAAGHKQVDVPLREPHRWDSGLKVWTEKNGKRIHFKIDSAACGKAMNGSYLEIRAETDTATNVLAVITAASASPAGLGTSKLPQTHLQAQVQDQTIDQTSVQAGPTLTNIAEARPDIQFPPHAIVRKYSIPRKPPKSGGGMSSKPDLPSQTMTRKHSIPRKPPATAVTQSAEMN